MFQILICFLAFRKFWTQTNRKARAFISNQEKNWKALRSTIQHKRGKILLLCRVRQEAITSFFISFLSLWIILKKKTIRIFQMDCWSVGRSLSTPSAQIWAVADTHMVRPTIQFPRDRSRYLHDIYPNLGGGGHTWAFVDQTRPLFSPNFITFQARVKKTRFYLLVALYWFIGKHLYGTISSVAKS